MIDPRDFDRGSLDELVLAYIDGDLTTEAGRRLETTLAALPEFQARVERARCLRALVSTLPRVAAPASVRSYTTRLATLPRSNAGSRVELALGLLPRRSAPLGLAERALAGVRAERVRVELAARRRAYRPSARELLRAAVAALVLVGVSLTLLNGRSVNRFSARKVVFDATVIRPDQPLRIASGSLPISIDPILAASLPSDLPRSGR